MSAYNTFWDPRCPYLLSSNQVPTTELWSGTKFGTDWPSGCGEILGTRYAYLRWTTHQLVPILFSLIFGSISCSKINLETAAYNLRACAAKVQEQVRLASTKCHISSFRYPFLRIRRVPRGLRVVDINWKFAQNLGFRSLSKCLSKYSK